VDFFSSASVPRFWSSTCAQPEISRRVCAARRRYSSSRSLGSGPPYNLYLKYQHIIGSRLLGGVSDAQIETLHARFEGRLPLPEFKAGPTVAHVRLVPEFAAGNEPVALLRETRAALQPANRSICRRHKL
jgi:hypothetical protein